LINKYPMNYLYLLIAISTLLTGCELNPIGPADISIHGTITDEEAIGIQEVQIVYEGTPSYSEEEITGTTWTNADGHFELQDLPLGHYNFELSKSGFQIKNISIEIDQNYKDTINEILIGKPIIQHVELKARPNLDSIQLNIFLEVYDGYQENSEDIECILIIKSLSTPIQYIKSIYNNINTQHQFFFRDSLAMTMDTIDMKYQIIINDANGNEVIKQIQLTK